jgi:hypothetical protein
MKVARIMLVVAVLVASGFFVADRDPAQAQLPDPPYTCAFLNDPLWDFTTTAAGAMDPFEFKAGDTIKVVAGYPPGQDPAPGDSELQLFLYSAPVKSAHFPGTITYTFASDTSIPAGMPSVGWQTRNTTGSPTDIQPAAWDISCSSAPAQEETSSEPVPGCDLGVKLTPNAAVGAFVSDTDVYWAPDANATTAITMPAGKTAWVLGMDETGEFYKFVWSCTLLWAPVGTMGPNHDDVWHGAALPTTVVS